MGLAKLLGFDLCPRLAMFRERKLYVGADQYVPKALRTVAVRLSLKELLARWDELLRLAASSIREGWCSASQVLARFGSDAQGDPLYQASVTSPLTPPRRRDALPPGAAVCCSKL